MMFASRKASSGSGITLITSVDSSVAITDPTGPTTDLSVSGGGGGVGRTLMLSYNGVGPFAVPVSSLPAGWDGTGIASMSAQLTTGPALVAGLQDLNGNPIPDGWSFPATIYVLDGTIFDIILSNAVVGSGPGFSMFWGSNGGVPMASFNLENGVSIHGATSSQLIQNSNATFVQVNESGGVTIQDDSSAGISIEENGDGGISIQAQGGEAVLSSAGGGVLINEFSDDGQINIQTNGGAINLNPNGASGLAVTNVAGLVTLTPAAGLVISDVSTAGISLVEGGLGPIVITSGGGMTLTDPTVTGITIQTLINGPINLLSSGGGIALTDNDGGTVALSGVAVNVTGTGGSGSVAISSNGGGITLTEVDGLNSISLTPGDGLQILNTSTSPIAVTSSGSINIQDTSSNGISIGELGDGSITIFTATGTVGIAAPQGGLTVGTSGANGAQLTALNGNCEVSANGQGVGTGIVVIGGLTDALSFFNGAGSLQIAGAGIATVADLVAALQSYGLLS